jgi:hypothetical protein
MTNIKINNFGGILPLMSPKLLPERNAQTAENCTLESGRIEPIHGAKNVSGATDNATIYKWRKQDDTTEWLDFSGDVNIVSGVVADDDKSRIFYTGDGVPKVKGWEGGVAVTKELKQTAPSAPVIDSVDPIMPTTAVSPITATQYVFLFKNGAQVANLGVTLTLSSYVYDKGNLILTFNQYYGLFASGLTAGDYVVLSSQYMVSVPKFTLGTVDNNAFTLPTSGTVTSTSPKFSSDKKALLNESNVKFADIQIVDCEDVDTAETFTVETGTTKTLYLAGGFAKFTINMNYVLGAETQYRYYIQALVNEWGMESPPSVNSALVEVPPGHVVKLKTLCATADDDARIYRTAAGNVETNFFFVADSTATTYTDKLNDSELSESLEVYENPDDSIIGLVALPQGFLAAFKDKEIHFSYPNLPNCWSTDFRLTIDYDIIGLGVSGNDLVILTNGFPYIASGSDPLEMSLARLPVNQACISKKSICTIQNMVVYASPDGLIGIQGGSVKNLTEKIFSKADWRAFLPADVDDWDTVISGVYDNRIYIWNGTSGLIVDFLNNNVTTTDVLATTVYSDVIDDKLYLVIDSNVKEWDESTEDYMKITWKSKEFFIPRPINFAATRIIADTYGTGVAAPDLPIKLSLFAKGVEVLTDLVIYDDTGIKIPDKFPSKQWSFQIESYSAIDEIILSTSMAAIRERG